MSIYPRTVYEMTKEDLAELLEACKPVPYIVVGTYAPQSPQYRANDAWARLGKKMEFDSTTVQPISGKSQRFFTAIPAEPEDQRKARLQNEEEQRLTAAVEESKKSTAKREADLRAFYEGLPGMTKREWFAWQALMVMLCNQFNYRNEDAHARIAKGYADAMIANMAEDE